MKSVRATVVTSTMLALLLLGAGRAALAEPEGPPRSAAAEPGARIIEQLEGPAARAYLEGQFRKKPALAAAAARSRQRLESLGFTPTDVVVTRRLGSGEKRPAAWERIRNFLVPPLKAQSFSQPGISITFWSWDDGNAGTWEGQVYIEDYQYGTWSFHSEQVDVSWGAELLWSWEEGSSGGTPRGGARNASPAGEIRAASYGHDTNDVGILRVQSYGSCPCAGQQTSYWGMVHANFCWRAAMYACQSEALRHVGACAFSGSSWPACTGAIAANQITQCSLDMVRSRWNRCGWRG